MSKYYGYLVDEEHMLFDATPLPNATSIVSGNDSVTGAAGKMIRVGDSGSIAEIRLYANTDITVATGGSLAIELQNYDSDDHSSAGAPFWHHYGANSSGWTDDAHLYLLFKDSGDDELTFKAGDLITAMTIPQGILRDRPYVQLKVTASGDLSAQKIDAFVRAVA